MAPAASMVAGAGAFACPWGDSMKMAASMPDGKTKKFIVAFESLPFH
jgi:hypothetical protein